MLKDTLMLKDKVRIQDIVAKTSGVNLEQVVKVLLALSMAAEAMGETQISDALHVLLQQSARQDDEPARLKSTPGARDVEYCEDAFDVLWVRYGQAAMRNVKKLRVDPYYTCANS